MLTYDQVPRGAPFIAGLAVAFTTFSGIAAAAEPVPPLDARASLAPLASPPSVDLASPPERPGRRLMITGILTTSLGGTALLTASAAMLLPYGDGGANCAVRHGVAAPCGTPFFLTEPRPVLLGVAIAGLAAIPPGIAMIVVGARRGRAQSATATATPEVAVGPARASVSWRF